jgi:hypothetical protein
MLPRPDLNALGVNYRRSPVMTIGRDVYLDSRLMIRKLEELFPPSYAHPALSSPATVGLAALLDKFTTDASLFLRAVHMMPPTAPALSNKAFRKDRAGFYAQSWTIQELEKRHKEAIAHVRHMFDIAELLFVDGRNWVASTAQPSLADLEGLWRM